MHCAAYTRTDVFNDTESFGLDLCLSKSSNYIIFHVSSTISEIYCAEKNVILKLRYMMVIKIEANIVKQNLNFFNYHKFLWMECTALLIQGRTTSKKYLKNS